MKFGLHEFSSEVEFAQEGGALRSETWTEVCRTGDDNTWYCEPPDLARIVLCGDQIIAPPAPSTPVPSVPTCYPPQITTVQGLRMVPPQADDCFNFKLDDTWTEAQKQAEGGRVRFRNTGRNGLEKPIYTLDGEGVTSQLRQGTSSWFDKFDDISVAAPTYISDYDVTGNDQSKRPGVVTGASWSLQMIFMMRADARLTYQFSSAVYKYAQLAGSYLIDILYQGPNFFDPVRANKLVITISEAEGITNFYEAVIDNVPSDQWHLLSVAVSSTTIAVFLGNRQVHRGPHGLSGNWTNDPIEDTFFQIGTNQSRWGTLNVDHFSWWGNYFLQDSDIGKMYAIWSDGRAAVEEYIITERAAGREPSFPVLR